MGIRECCKNDDNLVLVEHRPEEVTSRGFPVDFSTRQCRVCGAKHHRLVSRPATLGVRGADMGARQ